MVLCENYYDPASKTMKKGLNLLSQSCVLPHHNSFGKARGRRLAEQNPDILFIGIDEETALINDGGQGRWKIYGKGSVTLYHRSQSQCYRMGETVRLMKNFRTNRHAPPGA
jgi:cyanophycinase